MVALDKQEVQEAIAEFIEKKYPELAVVKGNIMFKINVHEEDKLQGAELIIIEKH